MSTDTTATSPTSAPLAVDAGRTWRTGLTSAGIAGLANLVVLAAARALGADMLVQQTPGAAPMEVGVLPVAVMTVAPILLATLLLLPLRRWGARAWRAAAAVGLALGVLTVPAPLLAEAGDGTRAALAVMHVVAGVVWFVLVRRTAASASR